MGFAPPPDGPPPGPAVPGQTAGSFPAQAGFAPGPPVATLCGFAIPSLLFFLRFLFPGFQFPPLFVFPRITIALNCNLDNPLSVSVSGPSAQFGGGRQQFVAPDPDAVELN